MSLESAWYQKSAWLILFRPLSLLFGWISQRHRQKLSAAAVRGDKPVVIVGNISVGGSGKTPLVLELIRLSQQLGLRPGVVSRGYGAQSDYYPLRVDSQTSSEQSGDEPRLIAEKTGVPVFVDPDRVRAVLALEASEQVDLIISDDGLQHYRLKRDLEIAVIDGARGLGNAQLLPEGPLRESRDRLNEVDLVVINGEGFEFTGALRYTLQSEGLKNLKSGEQVDLSPDALGATSVNALAAIGNPERFFEQLRRAGFDVNGRGLKDHSAIQDSDLNIDLSKPLIITEKDAVKCETSFPDNTWVLQVTAVFAPESEQLLSTRIAQLVSRN